MLADEFRRTAGEVKWDIDDDGHDFLKLENPDKFRSAVQKLRVLARATPEDKYNIVFGLQQIGQKVVMTGDGCNDADALRTADVGIAMGEDGCEAAKDSADVILTNDSFANILTLTMWGRTIVMNVRKFIQFQVTCNLACLGIVLISAAVYGQSPFTVF